jgi:hypothetical protein
MITSKKRLNRHGIDNNLVKTKNSLDLIQFAPECYKMPGRPKSSAMTPMLVNRTYGNSLIMKSDGNALKEKIMQRNLILKEFLNTTKVDIKFN